MTRERDGSSYIYHIGFTFKIRPHDPPLPFGHPVYKKNWPNPLPPAPSRSENLGDYIFRVSPIATAVPQSSRKVNMTITAHIASDKLHGAQSLVCTESGQNNSVYFVKIYDPQYYDWIDGYGPPRRVVMHADADYSREASAYDHLDKHGQNGELAPKYYGSWTFDLHDHQGRKREVRLILTEYIPAPSLWQEYYIDPMRQKRSRDIIPPNCIMGVLESFRLKVFKILLDIRSKQLHVGINQRDFAPRNVLIVLEDSEDQELEDRIKRVVVVDYNISTVFHLSDAKVQPSELPRSPVEIDWNHWLDDFGGWIPRTWLENEDIYREWLIQEFGSREGYAPFSTHFSERLKVWQEAQRNRNALQN